MLRSSPSKIVVFGRPGSGKSSVAERLGTGFGFTLIRTGELLRAAVRRGVGPGAGVQDLIKEGNLVSDDLILELLQTHLPRPVEGRWLFDGFPRTLGQVPILETLQTNLGFSIDAYLDIHVDRQVAIDRMTGRRVCPSCGATYHTLAKPPRVPETCDHDSQALERRADDRMEVVLRRQEIYDQQTQPILEHYRKVCPEKLLTVQGNQTPDLVQVEVERLLQLA